MLAPKRVKFRKRFKGRTKGMATRGNTLVFGHYALMVLEPGWITNRQIEHHQREHHQRVVAEHERVDGARAGVDHESPDRGGAGGADARDEARRQDVAAAR